MLEQAAPTDGELEAVVGIGEVGGWIEGRIFRRTLDLKRLSFAT